MTMETVTDLEGQLAALRRARNLGVSVVRQNDRETRFKSDAEMASAIADLERRISQLRGGRINTVRIYSSKGL